MEIEDFNDLDNSLSTLSVNCSVETGALQSQAECLQTHQLNKSTTCEQLPISTGQLITNFYSWDNTTDFRSWGPTRPEVAFWDGNFNFPVMEAWRSATQG